ncbi:MAG: BatD family protein [Verrucomicrobia bacterium]|nr:BatD family protein [Verrucomicrobiota bacterium]
MLRLLFRLPLPLLLVATLHAQTVRWEPGSGTLALNQLSELNLIFDQCEPSGTVALPAVAGLEFGTPSRAEQNSFSILNGSASRSHTVSLTYRVRPTEQRTVRIPAFDVITDKGRLHVAPATFEIGDATVGQSNLSLEAVVQSRFTLPEGQVWAGEVFPLTYSLNVARRYFYQLGSDLDWNPAPLSVEPWSKPEPLEATLNGEARISIFYKTRAYAKTAGTIPLNPATQLVNLATGTSTFTVFARPNLEQFSITSKPAELVVRPLPAPAPAGFNGAVGQFTLESKVVPATAAVGEPVTWTLTLAGTGNWPDVPGLPARSVSKDFRVVQPQAKRVNKDNALFEATLAEDIVLIPTKAGPYTLGPVTFSYFDPKTGAYQTVTTEPVTITVAPAAAPTPVSGEPKSETEKAAAGSSGSQPSATSAQPPATLPRDPLPPAASAGTPVSSSTLRLALLSSLLCPLLVWAGLALRRARLTDPRRPLREARHRLAATLHRLRSASDPDELAALIQAWQRDAAALWQLPAVVPTAGQFTSEDWAGLWSDSERVLYRPGTALPTDWLDRAGQALAAKRVPGFSAFQLFLPRNLLPLALLALACVAAQPVFAAEAGASAYAKTDFAAAANAWRETLKTEPTAWTARHNLSLALVQQNQWGEAAGQALAAFVQQPADPAVRGHLDFTLKGAGLQPAEIAPFIQPDLPHELARLASPACWQLALVSAVWLAALALGLWLWCAYRGRSSLKPVVGSFLVIAALLAGSAGLSLHTYGVLADARAVFVAKPSTLRSIPTDIDAPQKSTPLAPGLIAITDKSFLGWQRLVFPTGQTGWVRSGDLVPLWR